MKTTKTTTKPTRITSYDVESFMSNVYKTDMNIHRRSIHDVLGTVTLCKPAYESKTGKRVYSLSGSKVAHSGSYSAAGLKRAFMQAVG